MKQTGTVKKQWDIRQYQEGDEEKILELRGITLGDSRSITWWKWIYKNGPNGPAFCNLAVIKQKIIGMGSGLPLRIRIGNQIYIGVLGFDIMTHPDYQRQGVLNTLDNIWTEYFVKNGFSLDYGTSTVQRFPIYQKLKVHHGYSYFSVCSPHVLVKVINWGSVFKTRYHLPTFIGKIFGYVWERITDRTSTLQKHNIETIPISSFDESINEFWQKACEIKKIIFVRDMKYLNWRYVEKPGNEYKIFVAKKQNEIIGYIVLKVVKETTTRGFIVDLLTIPGESIVAELMINRAIGYLQEEGVESILCLMLQDTPYYETLKKKGFIRRQSGIQLNMRIFDQNLSKEFVHDPGNWYYTWGDGDTI